nr:transcription factor myc4 [Quercus suber]
MSKDRVPHATPSIASIFPPNYSGSGGSASDQTIPQYSNSISIIFPPIKSQTESSESNQRLTRFSQYSISSIFPPTKSQTESSESNQRFGQSSHSIPSIFPPTKSQTDQSSESNQRFGQSSHSIPSIFPPTKSQTTRSSESNQRLTRFSQYSIPSIFQPNMSDDTNSLDSMPKDMRNTKKKNQSIKGSMDVPEFKDLRWSRVVCPFKQTLQNRLQRMIEDDFLCNWTYAIFWKLSHDYSGVPILDWGFGYYQGKKVYLNNGTFAMEEEHVKKMLVNLSLSNSGSVDEQELTDTEWFFLASKMLSFVNGSDLPGKAFTTSNPDWVVGVSSLASSPYDRARQGQHSGLQTMMFVPFQIGVVELGSTKLLFQQGQILDSPGAVLVVKYWSGISCGSRRLNPKSSLLKFGTTHKEVGNHGHS